MLWVGLDVESGVRPADGPADLDAALALRVVQPEGRDGSPSRSERTVHLARGGDGIVHDGQAEGQEDVGEGGVREGELLGVHDLGPAWPVPSLGRLVVDVDHWRGDVGCVDLDGRGRRGGEDALGDWSQAACGVVDDGVSREGRSGEEGHRVPRDSEGLAGSDYVE